MSVHAVLVVTAAVLARHVRQRDARPAGQQVLGETHQVGVGCRRAGHGLADRRGRGVSWDWDDVDRDTATLMECKDVSFQEDRDKLLYASDVIPIPRVG